MATRQSTTLHIDDGEDNALAFSTLDPAAAGADLSNLAPDRDPVLEVWGTIFAADGQPLNARLQLTLDDVRDVQAFLADQYGRKVAVGNLQQEYPYVSGEATVLGPQVFVSPDGQVINYQGTNYHCNERRADAPKNEIEASIQTKIDGIHAQFFKDGWHASLRELLEVSKIRGYEAAVGWAKGQMAAHVGPAALSLPAQQIADTELPGMWEQSDFSGGEADTVSDLEYATRLDGSTMPAPSVVPNENCWCGGAVGARTPGDHLGIGCLSDITHNWSAAGPCTLEGCSETAPHYHQGDDEIVRTAPSTPEVAAPVAVEDCPFILGPKNAAEQDRKRRLKVELAFDEAAEKYKADPGNPDVVAALNEAATALHKREPDNSRVVNFRFDGPFPEQAPTHADAPAQQIADSQPGPAFAAEPVAQVYQPIPYNGGDRSLHEAEEQAERELYPAAMTQQQVIANQQAFNGSQYDTPQEYATAAQAFPCPHPAADGRPCQRPAGHEIELPNRPAKPHIYATSMDRIQEQGAAVGVMPVVQQPQSWPTPVQGPIPGHNVAPVGQPQYGGPAAAPAQAPNLQVVPDPQPQPQMAVMSFHEGEPGMPAAPSMPTWTAPQQ